MERTEVIGRIGEIRFAMEAISRGFTVLYPDGVMGYDCVLEVDGKYTKVQIKTTSVIDQHRRYAWNINRVGKEAEVFVMHVLNTNLFYMVRANVIKEYKAKYKIPLKNIHNKNLHDWKIFK